MEEEEKLTKREKRALAKEEKLKQRKSQEISAKFKKIGILAVVVAIIIFLGFSLYKSTTKTLPGQEVADIGAEHTNDISGITYNSNPPTSGTHFPVWAKKGAYDRVISDGYLIHSLEHGYVVISYNCQSGRAGERESMSLENLITSTLQLFNSPALVSAHETDEPHEEPLESTSSAAPLTRMLIKLEGNMSAFTPENPPDDEIGLPGEFQSEDCKKLVGELAKLLEYRQRVIVVPRPSLDTKIALTAWGRVDKMDDFDEVRIKEFIKAFHNRGPEQTVE